MTHSELILLSLIAEHPRHGYEIERIIEERGMRNWTDIAFSSIYFVLGKLVRSGLAASAPAPAAGRGPAKKVFSATPAGMDALRVSVAECLRDPKPGSQFFLFGLSNLTLLGKSEALQALNTRRQALAGTADNLSRHPALTEAGFPPHVTAMFTYSLTLIRAELGWLDDYLTEFEKGA